MENVLQNKMKNILSHQPNMLDGIETKRYNGEWLCRNHTGYYGYCPAKEGIKAITLVYHNEPFPWQQTISNTLQGVADSSPRRRTSRIISR